MRIVGKSLAVPSYKVANLPVLGPSDRAVAYASDGRALNTSAGLVNLTFEAAGQGTGVFVSWNGVAWKVAGMNSTVQS